MRVYIVCGTGEVVSVLFLNVPSLANSERDSKLSEIRFSLHLSEELGGPHPCCLI